MDSVYDPEVNRITQQGNFRLDEEEVIKREFEQANPKHVNENRVEKDLHLERDKQQSGVEERD